MGRQKGIVRERLFTGQTPGSRHPGVKGHVGEGGPGPAEGAYTVTYRRKWGQMLEPPETQAEGVAFEVVETPSNLELSILSGETHWGHNLAHS